MAIFDKIGEFAKNVGDRTGDFIETNRLNSKITTEKASLSENERRLGEYYFSKYMAGIELEPEVLPLCEAIKAGQENVAMMQEEISKIKAANGEQLAEYYTTPEGNEPVVATPAPVVSDEVSSAPIAPAPEEFTPLEETEDLGGYVATNIPEEMAVQAAVEERKLEELSAAELNDKISDFESSVASFLGEDFSGLLDEEEETETPAEAAPAVATKECVSCGATLEEWMVFCQECGAKQEEEPDEAAAQGPVAVTPSAPVCPNCGAVMPEGTNFCGECGSKIV